MKRSLLKVLPILGVVALAFTSCSKECCDCGSAAGYSGEICKSDYEDSGASAAVPWSTYKTALKAAGCSC